MTLDIYARVTAEADQVVADNRRSSWPGKHNSSKRLPRLRDYLRVTTLDNVALPQLQIGVGALHQQRLGRDPR